MSLISQLNKLKKSELIELLSSLAKLEPAAAKLINLRLEAALGPETPSLLLDEDQAEMIKSEFSFWRRQAAAGPPRPVGLKDLSAMTGVLDSIVGLFENGSTVLAFELVEEYLALQDDLFGYLDDSDGTLGDVFRDATDLWLEIAVRLRNEQPDVYNWLAKVKRLFDQNDYGCQDELLENSEELLTTEELRQLAWQFEKDQRAAWKNPSEEDSLYNEKAAHAAIGLSSVGLALEDFSLVEKSLLIGYPKPNDLQLTHLLSAGIDLAAWDRVEHWLQPKYWESDQRRREVEQLVCEQKGDLEGALDAAWQNYDANPFAFLLATWWELASPKERKAKQPLVNKHIRQHTFLREAIDLAIISENPALGAEVLIQHNKETDGIEYRSLVDWKDVFEEQKLWLAAAICYRMLVDDILRNGRTKAYPIAADYLKEEQQLAKRIKRYQQHPNAKDYLNGLKDLHGRKKSFWKHMPDL